MTEQQTSWLEELATKEAECEEVATEMILRALRTGAETVNYRILTRLSREGSLSVAELMAVSGLGRLSVLERVNDLTQAGLASRALESDRVQATRLTVGLVGLIEGVKRRLTKKIEERLPRLLKEGR